MTYPFLEHCDKFTGGGRNAQYNLMKIRLKRRYQTRFKRVMAMF
jgi:hypothetical protein